MVAAGAEPPCASPPPRPKKKKLNLNSKFFYFQSFGPPSDDA